MQRRRRRQSRFAITQHRCSLSDCTTIPRSELTGTWPCRQQNTAAAFNSRTKRPAAAAATHRLLSAAAASSRQAVLENRPTARSAMQEYAAGGIGSVTRDFLQKRRERLVRSEKRLSSKSASHESPCGGCEEAGPPPLALPPRPLPVLPLRPWSAPAIARLQSDVRRVTCGAPALNTRDTFPHPHIPPHPKTAAVAGRAWAASSCSGSAKRTSWRDGSGGGLCRRNKFESESEAKWREGGGCLWRR